MKASHASAQTLSLPEQQPLALALGGNIAPRARHLKRALTELQERVFSSTAATSLVYETAALLPENALPEWDMPYLNLVAIGDSNLHPHAVLQTVKQIEQELGRIPAPRWSPRCIDIDILKYGNLQQHSDDLVIPHPQMQKRPFVLVPLAELWPDAIVAGKTTTELALQLQEDPSLIRRGSLSEFED